MRGGREIRKGLAWTSQGVLWLFFALMTTGWSGGAGDLEESARVIREVKTAPEFEVRKIQGRRLKEKDPSKSGCSSSSKPGTSGCSSSSGPRSGTGGGWDFSIAADIFRISFIGLLVALVAWIVWINRHLFARWLGKGEETVETKKAKVVLGMDVTPESLPPDVVSAARALHAEGRTREAHAMLYRAAISYCISVARVGIRESDTEGDCVRRVGRAGEQAHAGFFHELTLAWMAVQYARVDPGPDVFEGLCGNWPYPMERRAA